tara:strand:- start:1101 stop:1691 length:591 start_codon:yes stop_codon:yes gene_type:complete
VIIYDVEQGTDEWLQARLGKPSASKFSKILTATGKKSTSQNDYMLELLAEELSGVSTFVKINDDMQRGLDLENQAIANYEFDLGVTTTVVGWVTNDEKTYGCSPDRMNLEVKCPGDKNYLKWELGDKLPTDHFCQVQGCMWLCEEDWWDFLSFSLTHGTFLVRAYRDQEWIDAMESEMAAFLDKKNEAKLKLMQEK